MSHKNIFLCSLLSLSLAFIFNAPGIQSWIKTQPESLEAKLSIELVQGPVSLIEQTPLFSLSSRIRQAFLDFFHPWDFQDAASPLGPWPKTHLSHLPWPLSLPMERGPYNERNPLQILILGDSMAALEATTEFRSWGRELPWADVEIYSKISSSLSNPEVLNWPLFAENYLNNQYYDLIILMIGSNDAQSIVEENHFWEFGTDEWTQIYQKRVNDFLQILLNRGEKVWWVGVPPMRSPSFHKRISKINSLISTSLEPFEQGSWIDLNPVLGDESGLY